MACRSAMLSFAPLPFIIRIPGHDDGAWEVLNASEWSRLSAPAL